MGRAPGFKNRRIWLDFSKMYELGHHFTCLNPNSLLVKWRWAMHLIPYPSSLITHVVGTVISFVQERKLKFRKDKWLTEVYVARKRGSLGMNPGLSGFKVSWKKIFPLIRLLANFPANFWNYWGGQNGLVNGFWKNVIKYVNVRGD